MRILKKKLRILIADLNKNIFPDKKGEQDLQEPIETSINEMEKDSGML